MLLLFIVLQLKVVCKEKPFGNQWDDLLPNSMGSRRDGHYRLLSSFPNTFSRFDNICLVDYNSSDLHIQRYQEDISWKTTEVQWESRK